MGFTHETVLLKEAVNALLQASHGERELEGTYIDGTFGRGGHSQLILSQLKDNARLIAVDKDPEAIKQGKVIEEKDPRFKIKSGSFIHVKNWLAEEGLLGKVDGVLLDLGLSSPQLDDATRGFSFMSDGPLDMRMNNAEGLSAKEWIASVAKEELAQIIREYGEERFAKRVASAIVTARELTPINTTHELAEIVSAAIPKWEKHKHPATRTFQAIRIHINRELEDLKALLEDVLEILSIDGRLVVISFHSLEDRIVKQFMKKQAKGDEFPPGLPITQDKIKRRMRLIGKAIRVSDEEVERNPRSRSAIMRVAEKLDTQ